MHIKIKKFFSNKKINIAIIVIALLLLINALLGFISSQIADSLYDQNEGERWSQERRMAQVSAFFTQDQKIEPNEIKRLEYQLKKSMIDAGISALEKDEEGSTIVDTVNVGGESNGNREGNNETDLSGIFASCYSAQGITTISFENKTAENITTIGVDGDFFLFHPLELVNGGYFGADDLMKDMIVIDEELAWELFGSSDVAGQCVTVGGINHYIAGVVRRQDGRINEAAGLSNSIVYMSYDSLCKYGSILSGRNDTVEISEDGVTAASGGINCYEAVIPNPVDGMAAKLLKESSGMEDRYISVVDNSNRFSGFSLLDVIRNVGIRSMWDKPVFYPYWENVARAWEDILARLFFIRIVCVTVAALIFATLVVLSYKNKTWTVSGIISSIDNKIYDMEANWKLKKSNK